MTYDEDLADRIRVLLSGEQGVVEKRMFGGLAFLRHGHMAVAASHQGGLLLRVDPALATSCLEREGVERFEMRGRRMDGWVRVDRSVLESDDDLSDWVRIAMTYVGSLRPKG